MEPVNSAGARTAGARWWVYLLRCADGTLYAGVTNDLERRLGAHARGRVKYTRGRLPVVIAWREEAGDKRAALRREWAIKRLRRREKLRLVDGGDGAARAQPGRRIAGSSSRGL